MNYALASANDSVVLTPPSQVSFVVKNVELHIICLLFHMSSGSYESLKRAGCLRLPSQCTLRGYTHYVQAEAGFSYEVDLMLTQAAKVDTCPEREKCVLFLLDEMHTREDIVFDKHSGEMISFANLGKINEHAFERDIHEANKSTTRENNDGLHGSWAFQQLTVCVCSISMCG